MCIETSLAHSISPNKLAGVDYPESTVLQLFSFLLEYNEKRGGEVGRESEKIMAERERDGFLIDPLNVPTHMQLLSKLNACTPDCFLSSRGRTKKRELPQLTTCYLLLLPVLSKKDRSNMKEKPGNLVKDLCGFLNTVELRCKDGRHCTLYFQKKKK